MLRQINPCTRKGQSGLSLIEVVVSLALLSMLSLITISGMMMHAHTAKSNLLQQQVAESSRRFIDAIQVAALDATIIRIETGPSGPNSVLTIGKPDPVQPGKVVYRQYAYIDADKNAATIRDNQLLERYEDAPMATTGNVLIEYCSPVPGTPIFVAAANTARPLYNINLRVGDRTPQPSNEDNAITGRGYQSFLISSSISKL